MTITIMGFLLQHLLWYFTNMTNGVFAVLILLIGLQFMQGFFASGECGIRAVITMYTAPKEKRGTLLKEFQQRSETVQVGLSTNQYWN